LTGSGLTFPKLYDEQGKHAKAETLYVRSLKILETSLESNRSNVAAAMNKLSLLYSYEGKYEEAEPLCRRTLGILEKNLGGDDPAVVKTRQNCTELAEKIAQQVEIKKMESHAKSLASPPH